MADKVRVWCRAVHGPTRQRPMAVWAEGAQGGIADRPVVCSNPTDTLVQSRLRLVEEVQHRTHSNDVQRAMGDNTDDDISFPPHDIDKRQERQYSCRILPGRKEVIQGKEYSIQERCPSSQMFGSGQQVSSEIQFFDDRSDKPIEDKAEDHRNDENGVRMLAVGLCKSICEKPGWQP